MSDFICTAWLKRACPFSFKFLLFATEAGLLDRFRIVEMVEGDPDYGRVKDELSAHLGKAATFPTVEVAPGTYLNDSDALIQHFAAQQGIAVADLQVLPFYLRGVMDHFETMYAENRAYREQHGPLN